MITADGVRRALRTYRPREEQAPEASPAAVALILREDAAGLSALFIRRAERAGDPWSGQVALPGGRHEPADADLLATAIRETAEEIGIGLELAERLGTLDDHYPRTPVLPPVVVRPFVFLLATVPPLVLSAEVTIAFWVPLQVLRVPATRGELRLVIGGAERVFPTYRVGEHVIWGMTERILTPFLDLAETSW